MSIPFITNQFESANYLADGEETQQLGSNDSSSGQLRRVNISQLLEDADWVSTLNEGCRISYTLDEPLEISLECGNRAGSKSATNVLESHR
jgi:hypothetical protein